MHGEGTTGVDIITISREYGAGGSELARQLGDLLGWPVLDRDIVQRVADRLRLDQQTVEQMDEHPPGVLDRIATMLLMPPVESPVLLDTSDIPSSDSVADAARRVILEMVESPPLIVVGHGGQSLLRARAGTLHIRLVAPIGERVKRICAREECTPDDATARIRRIDADRRAYVRRYYQGDWDDPLLYDIQLNTARVAIEECTRMIAGLVRARGGVPAGSG